MTNIVLNIYHEVMRRIKRLFKRLFDPILHHHKTASANSPWQPAVPIPAVATVPAMQESTQSLPYLPPPPEPESIFTPIPEKKPSKFPTIAKIHVPMLLRFKRIAAGILVLFNFMMSQFVLGWGGNAQVFALVFLGNAFILIDYLWKTRRGDVSFKKKDKT